MHRGMVAELPGRARERHRVSRVVGAARTLGALALLAAALPLNLAVTAAALLRSRSSVRRRPRDRRTGPRTVLVSGGKMTKALQLARSFHAAGHRVVLVESRQVPAHRSPVLPRGRRVPRRARAADDPGYADGAARHRPARGRRRLRAGVQPGVELVRRPGQAACSSQYCEVLHGDPETIGDASTTSPRSPSAADARACRCPDTHRDHRRRPRSRRSTSPRRRPAYVLKSIPYDPVQPPRPHPAARARPRGRPPRSRAPSRSRRTTRGSCRRSSAARSTARTAPSATASCRCTAAASPRRSS